MNYTFSPEGVEVSILGLTVWRLPRRRIAAAEITDFSDPATWGRVLRLGMGAHVTNRFSLRHPTAWTTQGFPISFTPADPDAALAALALSPQATYRPPPGRWKLPLALMLGAAAVALSDMAWMDRVTLPADIIVANQFLAYLDRHDFRDARSLMAPNLRSLMPESTLQQRELSLEASRGKLIGRAGPQWRWTGRNSNGIVLTYNSAYEHATTTSEVTIDQTPDGPRVVDFAP